MVGQALENLPALYEADETAWLDVMAELIRERRLQELDYLNLQEYLSDMARRDRKEVTSRLRTLMTHVLRWIYEPEHRTRHGKACIVAQQHTLADEVENGVLREHAQAILPEAYADSVEQAVIETELPETTFPKECPWIVDELVARDLLQD
jgi:hypothetical protein